MADAGGLAWWEAQLALSARRRRPGAPVSRAGDALAFGAEFFPALLRACEARALPAELSMDELRVLARFCLGSGARERDSVARQDVRGWDLCVAGFMGRFWRY